jgi:hypothetical protein
VLPCKTFDSTPQLFFTFMVFSSASSSLAAMTIKPQAQFAFIYFTTTTTKRQTSRKEQENGKGNLMIAQNVLFHSSSRLGCKFTLCKS